MPRVLVPIAEGFEEIETATIVDVLRRAGVDVVLASVDESGPIRGSRGMVVCADVGLAHVHGTWDLVVLPGGMKNAERLAASDAIRSLLAARFERQLPIAAICAAPLALDAAGVLTEGQFTCYPGVEARIAARGRRDERIVDTGDVITSQGPGTAMPFALHLVERLCGREARDRVAGQLLYADAG